MYTYIHKYTCAYICMLGANTYTHVHKNTCTYTHSYLYEN